MRPLAASLIALALIALAFVGIAPPARADDPTPLPQPTSADSNPVGACLAAGQVWLIVLDLGDEVVANQCVGNPTDGEQALRNAGVQIGYGRNRLICTLDGRPERCPTSFDGSFWNYHHAKPGSPWVYSAFGAANRRPEAGSIEAWCYNTPDTTRCTPPQLRIVIDGSVIAPPGVGEDELVDPAPIVRPPLPPASTMSITTVLSIVAVLALLGIMLVLARRRRGPAAGPGIPTR